MTKRCWGCKETKEVSEFHRRGRGYQDLCKPCMKAQNAKYYQTNKDRIYQQGQARRSDGRYLEANREREQAYLGKVHARKALAHAIELGEIIRPSNCSRCNMEGVIHGHHTDYSKPLQVEWLCASCHAKEHDESYS